MAKVMRPVPVPVPLAEQRAAAPSGPDARFRAIYDAWFDDVSRWLYALGVPAARHRGYRAGDLPGRAPQAGSVRRRQPGRLAVPDRAPKGARSPAPRLVQEPDPRRKEVDLAELPQTRAGPAAALEDAEEPPRVFQALVAKMSEKLRTTFVLFEIEGYSGEEIARIQDIPLGTVWTRLHHARKEFWKLVPELGASPGTGTETR